jgi:hypothetical protein
MSASSPGIHSIIPLALLEAMRNLDTPIDDGLAELDGELMTKRLGLSTTVASQIVRYRQAAEKNVPVPLDEVVSVFRLVSRRGDAELVYSDAGRRAARYSARRTSGLRRGLMRICPRGLRRRLGVGASARCAAEVFGAEMRAVGALAEVRLTDSLATRAGAEGMGCYFYGAAFAELLRVLGGFEGAMLHEHCRSRGDASCTWRATTVETYE